jgi:hypothetical protein
MGNYIWTAILYFSTFGIVYVVFQTFIRERREDAKTAPKYLVNRPQPAPFDDPPPKPWEQKRRA